MTTNDDTKNEGLVGAAQEARFIPTPEEKEELPGIIAAIPVNDEIAIQQFGGAQEKQLSQITQGLLQVPVWTIESSPAGKSMEKLRQAIRSVDLSLLPETPEGWLLTKIPLINTLLSRVQAFKRKFDKALDEINQAPPPLMHGIEVLEKNGITLQQLEVNRKPAARRLALMAFAGTQLVNERLPQLKATVDAARDDDAVSEATLQVMIIEKVLKTRLMNLELGAATLRSMGTQLMTLRTDNALLIGQIQDTLNILVPIYVFQMQMGIALYLQRKYQQMNSQTVQLINEFIVKNAEELNAHDKAVLEDMKRGVVSRDTLATMHRLTMETLDRQIASFAELDKSHAETRAQIEQQDQQRQEKERELARAAQEIRAERQAVQYKTAG